MKFFEKRRTADGHTKTVPPNSRLKNEAVAMVDHFTLQLTPRSVNLSGL